MLTSAAVPMVPASGSTAAASNSPCAACKFLRRKCQPDCVFAPYFPPDKPQKFVQVHKVFGASNVTKLLSELNPFQREDAVNSLAYEAETRLRDPVYGCVGVISLLQHQLRELQQQLARARMELSKYQAAATLGAATAAAVAGNVNQQLLFGEQFFLSPVAGDVGGQGQLLMGRGCDAVDAAVRMGAHGGASYDAASGGSFGCTLAMNVPPNAASGVGSLGLQFAKQWTISGEERRAVGPS